jgi:hypothetical protein
MELIPAPELDRSQSEWKTIRGDDQAGVHQDSTGYMVTGLSATRIAHGKLLEDADRFRSSR